METVIIEAMSRDALQVQPNAPIADVMLAMSRGGHSAAVVCEKLVPIGIVTEQDALTLLTKSLAGREVRGLSARDVMTSPVFTLSQDRPLDEVVQVLRKRHFRRIPVVDEDGRLVGIVSQTELVATYNMALESQSTMLAATVEDRTRDLREANARLEALTLHDPLTQVENRRAMEIVMGQSHRVALRYGDHYSIAIIDIDDFKPYNDHYGHLQGDDALRKVARALQSGLRRSDRLFRYGGEEFAVLLPQTRLEGAATAADRLRLLVEDLQIEHELGTHQVLTVSCGVAEVGRFGPFPEHWSEIISQADQALYEAKRRGRNRVSVAAEGQADVPDIESD